MKKNCFVLLLTGVSVGCLLAQSPCSGTGAVVGIDPLANWLMVKQAGGYIQTIEVGEQTPIVKLPLGGDTTTKIGIRDVHSGDLVCVQSAAGSNKASRISVAARGDVEKAQREFLARWQNDSVYGTVSATDLAAQQFTITPILPAGTLGLVRVRITADTKFRTFPSTAMRVSDASSISAGDIQLGRNVYIRGRRTPGDPVLVASVVVDGGFRGILGAVEEVHPLSQEIRILEFGTGRHLSIQIPSGGLFRTTAQIDSPTALIGPGGVRLERLEFSDLQPGDALLIIGKTEPQGDTGTGLAAVSRFGYFGASPNAKTDEVGWFFE